MEVDGHKRQIYSKQYSDALDLLQGLFYAKDLNVLFKYLKLCLKLFAGFILL